MGIYHIGLGYNGTTASRIWTDSTAIYDQGAPDIVLGPEPRPETWTCLHCGTVNRADQLECGAGEWNGCGAPMVKDEPPRVVMRKERVATWETEKHLGTVASAFEELGNACDELKYEIGNAFIKPILDFACAFEGRV